MNERIFDYDLPKLKDNYKKVVSNITKYKGVLKGIPKVYFIINNDSNEVVYIGSSKHCLFTRIYYHINESLEMVVTYDNIGHVRPQNNDFKKTRTFCDLVYNLYDFEVFVFGEYRSLNDAEIAEKALIYYCSNFKFDINLCNSTGVKKLSTLAIKKKL